MSCLREKPILWREASCGSGSSGEGAREESTTPTCKLLQMREVEIRWQLGPRGEIRKLEDIDWAPTWLSRSVGRAGYRQGPMWPPLLLGHKVDPVVVKYLVGKLVPAILFLQGDVHLLQPRTIEQHPHGVPSIAKAPEKSRVIAGLDGGPRIATCRGPASSFGKPWAGWRSRERGCLAGSRQLAKCPSPPPMASPWDVCGPQVRSWHIPSGCIPEWGIRLLA